MKVGNTNSKEQVVVIAEIGNNHEGDFQLAKDMITAAAETGANAVKFQTIIPQKLVSVQETKRIEQLSRFQFSYEQFEELHAECESNDIQFLSTPFDLESVNFLNKLVPLFKVASGDNNFIPLIKKIAETGKPIVMSSGLMGISELKNICSLIRTNWKENGIDSEIAILHCVTSYPTPIEEANLSFIKSISELGVTPGYSDHTLGIEACVLSVALGARIIEKHFTLDKNYSDFRDHQLSADPQELKLMIERIREAEQLIGNPAVEIQSCEEASLISARRSIAANCDLSTGTVIEFEHLCWVRPGSGIKPGLEEQVLGKKLKVDMKAGDAFVVANLE